jgi:hypothetical protein
MSNAHTARMLAGAIDRVAAQKVLDNEGSGAGICYVSITHFIKTISPGWRTGVSRRFCGAATSLPR